MSVFRGSSGLRLRRRRIDTRALLAPSFKVLSKRQDTNIYEPGGSTNTGTLWNTLSLAAWASFHLISTSSPSTSTFRCVNKLEDLPWALKSLIPSPVSSLTQAPGLSVLLPFPARGAESFMKICCVWDHVTSWQHFQVEYVGITADTSEADVVLWTCAVPLVVLCLYCVPSSKHDKTCPLFSTKEDGHPRMGFIHVYHIV